MKNRKFRNANSLKIGAVAVLAAGLLAGSVGPSAAAAAWPPEESFSGNASQLHPGFHRHFWRGSQLSRAPAPAEMMAVAEEPTMDEASSYCASRFRSYDPATGTYLGYDGHEHACP